MSIRANLRHVLGPCCLSVGLALTGTSCNENNPPPKSDASAAAAQMLTQAPAAAPAQDTVIRGSTSGVVGGTGVPNGDATVSGPLAAATATDTMLPAAAP